MSFDRHHDTTYTKIALVGLITKQNFRTLGIDVKSYPCMSNHFSNDNGNGER